MERAKSQSVFLSKLQLPNFLQRKPWIGGDLQTLRDTFVFEKLPKDCGERIEISVPKTKTGMGSGKLVAFLDRPKKQKRLVGLVLILHGLGGSSKRQGLRRMGQKLLQEGFAVIRLNLRGADPGRIMAPGTYSACCNSDLTPVIRYARELCNSLNKKYSNSGELPLYGVGLSLGGTMLLNACMASSNETDSKKKLLDALVCVSSPLDLSACSSSIERPRNFIYQRWLLWRLVRQTLADPFGVVESEKEALTGKDNYGKKNISSIRDFDAAITAPRWGYLNVDDYYQNASPLKGVMKMPESLPKLLIIQSLDDPWVPSQAAEELEKIFPLLNFENNFQVFIVNKGGHNGFHGKNYCWGDAIVSKWLKNIL